MFLPRNQCRRQLYPLHHSHLQVLIDPSQESQFVFCSVPPVEEIEANFLHHRASWEQSLMREQFKRND